VDLGELAQARLDGVDPHTARLEPGRDGAGDQVGVEVELARQERPAVLVELAEDARRTCDAVQRLLEVRLDERALLLGHEDLVEAVRELARDLGLDRPQHPELEDPDAGALEAGAVDAERAQRVHQVVVGLAGAGDAEPGALRTLDPIHAVLARVGKRQLGARAEHRLLHVERRRGEQVAVRHVLVGLAVPLDRGHHRHDSVARDRRGAERVGHARDDLEAGPQPGRARAGERVEAEVEHLLHVAGEEHRHVQAREQRLGRARDRGGLAARVVAHDGERAASARHADEVAVAERVGGAVETRRLAVPHGQHAVVLRAGQLAGELAAPRRGGTELLVEPGHVLDVVALYELAVAGELLVEPAERRALVAGDHRARHEAAAKVGAVLVERQPDEALKPGEEDAALLEDVLVVERDVP
jgi:hypothetical protein